jgi:lipid II:glycine glycyltransferase (peptidoglycan interpeptide bridge formation enzyme)
MSDYYRLHELNGEGEACLFVYETGGGVGIYPFMKKRIRGYPLEGEYYDIQTAYGYGGPTATSESRSFWEGFESAFLDYAKSSAIVAEFVRFHPLLRNHGGFIEQIQVEKNRTTVVIDVREEEDAIFARQVDGRGRRAIRKAYKASPRVSYDYDVDVFSKLYESTMRDNNASEYYYFSSEYFAHLGKIKGFNVVNVILDEQVAASGIFIGHGMYCHYHLYGRDKAFSGVCVGHNTIWEAVKIARGKGYSFLHLGGGRTNEPSDSLFVFKKQFSRDFRDFYIGKRVLNEKVYSYLIEEWRRRTGASSAIFLAYNGM